MKVVCSIDLNVEFHKSSTTWTSSYTEHAFFIALPLCLKIRENVCLAILRLQLTCFLGADVFSQRVRRSGFE